MTITVYFTLDTDPDIAQVQVQNRVNLALPQLPEAVMQYGVSVQKKSSSTLMIIAMTSRDGRYSPDYVSNYANVYVLDAIKRVNGAGQAQIFAVPDQAMRIWMNPDRMASLGITTTDIQNAVAKKNALFGAGQVDQQPSDDQVQGGLIVFGIIGLFIGPVMLAVIYTLLKAWVFDIGTAQGNVLMKLTTDMITGIQKRVSGFCF